MQIGESISVVFSVFHSEGNEHWIKFRLVRKPVIKKEAWMVPDVALPYASVKYEGLLTNGTVSEVLSGNGTGVHNHIPKGKCSISFKNFYDDIEQWLTENSYEQSKG